MEWTTIALLIVPLFFAVTSCMLFNFGGPKTSTSTTDARTAASEGSIAVGQGGKYLEAAGVDVSGSSGARLGTTEVSGGGDVSITTADPGVLTDALARVSDLSGEFQQTLGDYAKESHIAESDNLTRTLKALGQLQEKTDKEGKQQKFILYLVLALLALLGVIFWPRFK